MAQAVDTKSPLNPYDPASPLYLLVLLFLALTFGRTLPLRLASFALIASIAVYLLFRTTSGKPVDDYLNACNIATFFFMASDFLVLTDPQKELRRLGQGEPIQSKPLLDRTKWAARLLSTPRGLGWTHEAPGTRSEKPQRTRLAFVATQLSQAGLFFIILDVGTFTNPMYHSGPNAPSVASQRWLNRMYNSYTYAVFTGLNLNIVYKCVSALAVTLHLYRPEDWPPLFGSILQATTVRNVWGRTWHQMLRRLLSSHGRFLSNNILHLKRGTKSYQRVLILGAFAVSGMYHQAADYHMLRTWTEGKSIVYFVLQGIVIILEDMVIEKGKSTGLGQAIPARLWKVIGFVWVVFWVSFSLPIMIDPTLKRGLGPRMGVSLVSWLADGKWNLAK